MNFRCTPMHRVIPNLIRKAARNWWHYELPLNYPTTNRPSVLSYPWRQVNAFKSLGNTGFDLAPLRATARARVPGCIVYANVTQRGLLHFRGRCLGELRDNPVVTRDGIVGQLAFAVLE
jgi:hypothetical protein